MSDTITKAVLQLIGVLAFGAVVLATVTFCLLGGPLSLARRRHFDNLVKTADHRALLAAAIPVIQATTNQMTFYRSHDLRPSITNLPAIIQQMEPNYVGVDPGRMRMEFHGGFDHYGFEIRRQDEWELTWYTERGHHPILTKTVE